MKMKLKQHTIRIKLQDQKDLDEEVVRLDDNKHT